MAKNDSLRIKDPVRGIDIDLELAAGDGGKARLAGGGDATTHCAVISLASTDYTDAEADAGFFIVTDGSGVVKVDTLGGEEGVVIPAYALPAGAIFPLRVTKVYKVGTVAANLCALR